MLEGIDYKTIESEPAMKLLCWGWDEKDCSHDLAILSLQEGMAQDWCIRCGLTLKKIGNCIEDPLKMNVKTNLEC